MPVCVYVTVVDGVMHASFFVDATRVYTYACTMLYVRMFYK